MLNSKVVTLFALFVTALHTEAQLSSCGLSAMKESSTPIFPAIAKAAHVQGTVVLLVSFTQNGEADTVTVVAGPEMLRQSAINYVRGWRANPFSGMRTCPIGIEYHLQNEGDKPVPLLMRKDLQHVTVNSGVPLVIPQTMDKGTN